jgi:hypothetical protein
MPFKSGRHTLIRRAGQNEEREECAEEANSPPRAEEKRGHGAA